MPLQSNLMPKITQARSRTAMHELHSQQFYRKVEQITEWMLPRSVVSREEKSSYVLLTGKAGGGWREADDGAVAVLVGRQREEDISHRLSQLRRLQQALLPKPRPASIHNPNFVVRNQTQRRRRLLQLIVGSKRWNLLEVAEATWCDGS
jgi:hypothetical protein